MEVGLCAGERFSLELQTIPLTVNRGFEVLKDAFDKAALAYESAETTMLPSMQIPIEDKEVAEKILAMIDALDELDDVQNVYHNAQFSDALMDQLSE